MASGLDPLHAREWLQVAAFAVAWADARGSGASFGSRPQEWSDDEIRDGGEIVDWIVRQPWSSGKVGSTGISYDGTAAEMPPANHHPATKAYAPRFSLFDPYTDIALPGGIPLSWFTQTWGKYNDALDRNALAERLAGFQRRIVKGVAPVDGHEDWLEQAVADHASNYSVRAWTSGITHRDDADESGLSMARVSPFATPAIAASGVPIYNYSGWYDGAYQRAAIARFLSYRIRGSRLIIGRWDHSAGGNASPLQRRRALATRWCGDDARFVRRVGEVAIPTTDPGLADGAELDCEQFPVVWRALA